MTEANRTSRADAKLGRNDPCHCGSGAKYKRCCASKDDAARSAELAAQAAERAARAQAEREQAEAEDDKAVVEQKPGRSAARAQSLGARQQRPKLPTAHSNTLPRRGAV